MKSWLEHSSLPWQLIWAGVIGVVGGLCSTAFRQAIFATQWLLTGHTGTFVSIALSLAGWQRLVIPALGGLAAGLILHLGRGFSRSNQPVDYLEAVAVGDGTIPVRPSLIKSASSLISISSGGSIGREGSIVQLAALTASWLGRRLGGAHVNLRMVTACGAAAGIASVYGAPVAGALFVSEIILGAITFGNFIPLLFAAVASTITARALGSAEPYFRTPALALVSSWEILPYIVMGLVLGVLAPAYVWLLRTSTAWFAKARVPVYVRLGLGGTAVGLISVFVPEVWGNGRSMVNELLGTHWLAGALFVLLLAKLAATTAILGSGAIGGVFTPTLFMGAVLGSLAGTGVELLMPGRTGGAPAFALAAMGAFLAATTRAPLMAIVMLLEMTLDYGIALPLILATACAAWVAERLHAASLYRVPR